MRWAERIAALLALLATGTVAGDEPKYGKVDTFEPGKKYNCVPTADRKGWDCVQTGKADIPSSPPPAPPPPPPPAPAAAPPPAAPASSPRASDLPSYLSADAAAGGPGPHAPKPVPGNAPPAAPAPAETAAPAPTPKTTPASDAAISTNPPAPRQEPLPAPSPPPVPPAPASVAEPVAAKTESPSPPEPTKPPAPPESNAEPAPAPAATASPHSALGARAFLGLPADSYVIELAHGDSEADMNAAAAAATVPRGELYALRFRQNGADRWVLAWGSFDNVDAARSARAELPGGATPRWPRRVGPLQAELRRTGE